MERQRVLDFGPHPRPRRQYATSYEAQIDPRAGTEGMLGTYTKGSDFRFPIALT